MTAEVAVRGEWRCDECTGQMQRARGCNANGSASTPIGMWLPALPGNNNSVGTIVDRCPVRLLTSFSKFCWQAFNRQRDGIVICDQTAKWFRICNVLEDAESAVRKRNLANS
jgi:hypothetical protein